jgi:hypothetical protein
VNKTLLLQENEYSIWKYDGVPDEVIAFFKKINWGSEGAVYERININELIPQLHDAHLVSVNTGETIQATAIFCKSDIELQGKKFKVEYIRYFAASAEIRGKKLIKHFAGRVMELVRQESAEKTIYIGCVEKGNIRSYKVVENAGYKRMGILTVNAFSRFFPKANKKIERILSNDAKEEVLILLRQQYHDYALRHFNYIFLNDNYYVIREQGEIVAACQFHRVRWVINNMPGFTGKIIMNVLPYLPLINKLFNPKQFDFLAFEGIYFKPGHEKNLQQLFEGLLAQEKLYSSLFWFGENCPVRQSILQYGKLGLLHSFVKDSGVMVMSSYQNMTEEEISLVESKPLYASAFDYI